MIEGWTLLRAVDALFIFAAVAQVGLNNSYASILKNKRLNRAIRIQPSLRDLNRCFQVTQD